MNHGLLRSIKKNFLVACNSTRTMADFPHMDYLFQEFSIQEVSKSLPPLLCNLFDAEDRNVLVIGELGYGDSIWLYRYVKELCSHAKHVCFLVPPKLVSLFLTDAQNSQLSNLSIVSYFPNFGAFDYFIWSFNLVSLFNFRFLTSFSYINIGDVQVNSNKIGIHFGNTDQDEGSDYRNLPLEYASYFTENHEVCNFSLQSIPNTATFYSFSCDFLDTARALKQVKYLICTDNCVLHLAGALGIKTYALFNSICMQELVWQFLEVGSIAWYKTVKPFVCKEFNDWKPQVEKIKIATQARKDSK